MNQPSYSITMLCIKRPLLIIALLLSVVVKAQEDPNDHIYEPERLVTQKDTMTVTGTIVFVLNEIDGDYHIRLRMDSNYVKLSKKNYTRQDSCIVLELVCAHQAIFPISCKCQGYTNKVAIPEIGTHMQVTGRLVYDRRHKWTELHPVYKMDETKQIPTELVRVRNGTSGTH